MKNETQYTPCKECPFKRSSLPGYLGESSNDPEYFLQSIEGHPIPCHMKVNWNNDDDEKIEKKCWTHPCIGSLQYMRNQCKLPRNPEYGKMVSTQSKSDTIFQWKSEFINHHA